MEIRRITHQGRKSLKEFYAHDVRGDGPPSREGERMLGLIDHLTNRVDGPLVWGLTSHLTLGFRKGDDYTLSPYLVIVPHGESFTIMCPFPAELSPWPDAWVQGTTSDFLQA